MQTPGFLEALEELMTKARELATTTMCAEAVPWRCHRQLLADALVVRGAEVLHVMGRKVEPHELTAFARVEDDRLVYDRPEQQRLPGV